MLIGTLLVGPLTIVLVFVTGLLLLLTILVLVTGPLFTKVMGFELGVLLMTFVTGGGPGTALTLLMTEKLFGTFRTVEVTIPLLELDTKPLLEVDTIPLLFGITLPKLMVEGMTLEIGLVLTEWKGEVMGLTILVTSRVMLRIDLGS